jgi:DNA-binding NtrC family response regulator
LRAHKEDIPLLVDQFVRDLGHDPFSLSQEVRAHLGTHDWPGNVRELRNVVERGLSLRGGDSVELAVGNIASAPPETERSTPGLSKSLLDMSFKDAKGLLTESFEREYLTHLLERHHGNISRAAVEAGIDRNYIHRLVKKYNLPVSRG